MLNHEMLEIVMKHIETHPETHDQNIWGRADSGCGTTACFAGWTMLLNGYTMQQEGRHDVDTFFVRPDGTAVIHESVEAAQLLGLSAAQASHMFLHLNTREELREYIDDVLKVQK